MKILVDTSVDNIVSALRGVRFRGKYRLLSQLAPRSGLREASVFGLRMVLDLSDLIQRNIYLGSGERQETSLLRSYLRPGMTFVDVGANVGYYSALASSAVRDGRVIAFEPNPYASERLAAWIKRNGVQNVTVCPVALGALAGSAAIYIGNETNRTSSMAGGAGPGTQISVRTLDDEMERLGVTRIHVLKIDVDGYESQVLAGASRLFAERRIGAILCEFSRTWLHNTGKSCEDLELSITRHGFLRRAMYGDDELSNRWFELG